MRIGIHSLAHTHGYSYLRVLAERPGVEVGLVDTPPLEGSPRGPEAAAAYGARYFDDLDQLLSWHPDGVIVCTETSRHREATEKIAGAGIHVLCEKPLATSLTDADAMIEACAAAGVHLMTAYPVRFSRPFAALQATLESGQLGELVSYAGANNGKLPSERAWFSEPAESGGGAIMDHTVHIADLLTVLLPDTEATSVLAAANTMINSDRARAETGGLVSIEYANGVIGTIDCSWSRPDSDLVWGGLTLQVLGTGGLADMDAFDSQQISGFSGEQGRPLRRDYGEDANAAMLAAFLDGIRTGVAPQPDGRSGRRSMAIALAAYESLATGSPVRPG